MANVVFATDTGLVSAPKATGSEMQAGEALYAGDALTSPNGLYTFVYQGDGNLVLYGPASSPMWSSNTGGQPAGLCRLVSNAKDGTRVTIYKPGMIILWQSPENDYKAGTLVVQDDGNVVVYSE